MRGDSGGRWAPSFGRLKRVMAPVSPALRQCRAATAPSATKDARIRGWGMPYRYVRGPLTADESDRLSNACETPAERLVVWTLIDTRLRVGELCNLTPQICLRKLAPAGSPGTMSQRFRNRAYFGSLTCRESSS